MEVSDNRSIWVPMVNWGRLCNPAAAVFGELKRGTVIISCFCMQNRCFMTGVVICFGQFK